MSYFKKVRFLFFFGFVLILLVSCEGMPGGDARENPPNPELRVKKNLEEGRGFRLDSAIKGNFGKGGDFLYRWGNPQVYNKGNSSNRRLFGQHDVQWIGEELVDEKKILIFNNGQSRGYSSIEIVNTQFQNLGYYQLSQLGKFIPDTSEWVYTANNPTDFFSSYISGAQRLKNGNSLICVGAHGTFFYIDKNKNHVWKYINPVVNNLVLNQGDSIPSSSNGWANNVFRAS